MKKAIKTIMMLFVASTFVLTSCTDDTDVKDVELTMIPAATSGTYFVSDTLINAVVATGSTTGLVGVANPTGIAKSTTNFTVVNCAQPTFLPKSTDTLLIYSTATTNNSAYFAGGASVSISAEL
jgi:hypothetical protein